MYVYYIRLVRLGYIKSYLVRALQVKAVQGIDTEKNKDDNIHKSEALKLERKEKQTITLVHC